MGRCPRGEPDERDDSRRWRLCRWKRRIVSRPDRPDCEERRRARRGGRPGGLRLPPSEHTHRPEGHPPRRLALSIVDVEPHPPRPAPVQRPGAVLQAPGANMVDRFAEPRIGGRAGKGCGRAEVVEPPEHVVAPSIRVREEQESLVGRLTGTETAEESPFQEIPPLPKRGPPAIRGYHRWPARTPRAPRAR